LCRKLHSNESFDIAKVNITSNENTRVVFLAMATIWIALALVCSLVPVFPIPGTPVWITLANIVTNGLTASLLGPLWGTLSGFVFGWLVPYVNPSTNIGLLTFLTPTVAALTSALVLFNRWKEALLLFAVEIGIWFANPFAWYEAMPVVTWGYWLALIFIVVSPVRNWIIKAIMTRNPSTLPLAIWCIAWISRMGDEATGNNIYIWIYRYFVYENWVPFTAYYAVADALSCVGAAVLGTGVLLALKRANIRITALDFLAPKKK
jgi:hypothetical protein